MFGAMSKPWIYLLKRTWPRWCTGALVLQQISRQERHAQSHNALPCLQQIAEVFRVVARDFPLAEVCGMRSAHRGIRHGVAAVQLVIVIAHKIQIFVTRGKELVILRKKSAVVVVIVFRAEPILPRTGACC